MFSPGRPSPSAPSRPSGGASGGGGGVIVASDKVSLLARPIGATTSRLMLPATIQVFILAEERLRHYGSSDRRNHFPAGVVQPSDDPTLPAPERIDTCERSSPSRPSRPWFSPPTPRTCARPTTTPRRPPRRGSCSSKRYR